MLPVNAETEKANVKETFKRRIKEVREEVGVSQEEFGRALGVTRATIGNYENGNRTPDITFLHALSKKTGCSVDYFLGGKNKVPPTETIFDEVDIDDRQFLTLVKLLQNTGFLEALRNDDLYNAFLELKYFASFGADNDWIQLIVEKHIAAKLKQVIQTVFQAGVLKMHAAIEEHVKRTDIDALGKMFVEKAERVRNLVHEYEELAVLLDKSLEGSFTLTLEGMMKEVVAILRKEPGEESDFDSLDDYRYCLESIRQDSEWKKKRKEP